MNVCTQLNFLAIIVGTLVYFFLGALWYSKAMFGPTWGKLHEIDFSDTTGKPSLAKVMSLSFVVMLLSVWAIAVLIHLTDVCTLAGGMKLGLLCGLFFSAATVSIGHLYLNKKTGLYFIEGGYHVVGYTIASIIITLWK